MASLFGQIFGLAGMAGMLISTVRPGMTAARDQKNIKKSLALANEKMKSTKERLKELYSGQAEFNAEINQSLMDEMNEIIKIREAIDMSIARHAVQYRKIQRAGVTFVVLILFLFLLQRFNIVNQIFKK